MLCIQALTRMTFGLMLGKDIACKTNAARRAIPLASAMVR